MIGSRGRSVSRNLMEISPKPEIQKAVQKSSLTRKNYSETTKKVNNLKKEERQIQIQEFLGHVGIKNSPELRDYLSQLLLDREEIDPHFSLYDLSKEEINEIRRKGSGKLKESTLQTKVQQGQLAEVFVDDLKQKGFSSYETLQKLLKAHETGEVTLLDEKYADFSAFFQELSAGQYGAKDTKHIIQTINDSGVDWTAPNAFEQVIWTIYEDDNISTATKEKIRGKFKLKPIATGDDLLDNLRIKKAQINQRAQQLSDTVKAIEALDTEITTLETDLSALKKAILLETDMEKRLRLEKEYDRLEALISARTKQAKTHKKRRLKLTKSTVSSKVLIRGLEAELVGSEIKITLPKSKRSLTVPATLGNEAIASTVNAYLVNDILKEFGMEEYFFYQSDFTGKFSHPTSLSRNDLFLYRLGLTKEGQVLSKADLGWLMKSLRELMIPEEYRVDLTLKENAQARLVGLEFLEEGLNHEKLANQLSHPKILRKSF